jgi:hypothetical protein
VDRFVDPADRALEGHFAALRDETLALVRPKGALAARRAAEAHFRRRRLGVLVAAAVALVLTALGGGYVLAGGHPAVNPVGPPQDSASPTHGAGEGNPAGLPGASVGPSTGSTVGPAGGPVPPSLYVSSITFINVNSSWALGWAPCMSPHQWTTCPAVIRSRDGGHTWAGVPAPGNAAYYGDIRFATAKDGWVLVRQTITATDPNQQAGVLYATHDGGSTWTQVSLPEPAANMESSGGRIWVVTGTGPANNPHSVFSAPITSDTFTRVGDSTGGSLAVHGHYAYVYGSGGRLTVFKDGTDGRPGWNGTRTDNSLPCDPDHQASAYLATSGDQSLALICAGPARTTDQARVSQPKLAFSSSDGGATWSPAGTPDPGGQVSGVAATTKDVFMAGSDMPVRERGSDNSWAAVLAPPDQPVSPPDQPGFGYIGFTDDQHGVVLANGRIEQTSDGGRTWVPGQPS